MATSRLITLCVPCGNCSEPPRNAEFGLIGLAGIAAALLGILAGSPLARIAAGLVLNGGYLVGAQMLFDHANLVVLTVGPLLALDISSAAVLAYDFIIEKLERAKLRHTMSLYFSPRVLEVVLADPGSMNPRRAEVTLLLTDLRNSTPLAERLGPKGMFELLVRSIVGQQLTGKAAETIYSRFKKMVGTVTPRRILKHDEPELRAVGLQPVRPPALYAVL